MRTKIELKKNKYGEIYELKYFEIGKNVWEWDGNEPSDLEVDVDGDELITYKIED